MKGPLVESTPTTNTPSQDSTLSPIPVCMNNLIGNYLDLYCSFVYFQPNITFTYVSLLLCKHDGCFNLNSKH